MAYQFDWCDEGFILTFEGLLSVQEIKDANHLWKKVPRIETIKYQVWDFSQADLYDIYESDTQDPTAYRAFPNMKVALISNDDYAKKLFDVYAQRAHQCGSNWELAIHETQEKAFQWIENKSTKATKLLHQLHVPELFDHVDLAFQS